MSGPARNRTRGVRRESYRRTTRFGDARRAWYHVGLYAYRRAFLLQFVALPRTAGERALHLEQLRALENGYRIRCAVLDSYRSVSIDVPADVAAVEHRLKELEDR